MNSSETPEPDPIALTEDIWKELKPMIGLDHVVSFNLHLAIGEDPTITVEFRPSQLQAAALGSLLKRKFKLVPIPEDEVSGTGAKMSLGVLEPKQEDKFTILRSFFDT